MARTRRTPLVILGLLCSGSRSGYELKSEIEGSIGHFWNESYGQLYPALKQLTQEGFVEQSDAPTGGRKRSEYKITEAGRKHLRQWLAAPPAPRLVRNELLVKLFFGIEAEQEDLIRHLEDERRAAQEEERCMVGIGEQLKLAEADAAELDHWLITLDLGRRTAIARKEWAEDSLKKLREKS